MKKLILAAATASLLASPLAIAPASAAPQRHDDRGWHKPAPRPAPRAQWRKWNKGQRFDHRYAQNYRVVNNWQQYRGRRLYAPPRGYHWVRSGNDAVLVAIAGGLIGAVIGGAFN
jgi:Ni/Co efflux regulator RcnB